MELGSLQNPKCVIKIVKIHKVAPEIFDFSKVALGDFEFDTPGLTVWSGHRHKRSGVGSGHKSELYGYEVGIV